MYYEILSWTEHFRVGLRWKAEFCDISQHKTLHKIENAMYYITITSSVSLLCKGKDLSKYRVTLPHRVFYSTNHCIKYKIQNSSNTICSVYILGWEQIGSNPTLKSISQNTKYKIAQKYKNCAQAGMGANTG